MMSYHKLKTVINPKYSQSITSLGDVSRMVVLTLFHENETIIGFTYKSLVNNQVEINGS